MDDLEVGDLIRARDIEETRAPGWIHQQPGDRHVRRRQLSSRRRVARKFDRVS